jgi:hypothetical protein
MEYEVQQKATIWYKTHVEASSAEEAIRMVASDGIGDYWEQVDDTTDFLPEFWTENTGNTDADAKSIYPEDD